MNIIDKSAAAHQRKCRREMANQPKPKRITKADILKDILAHFPRTIGKLDTTGVMNKRTGRPNWYIRMETDHGKADRIGQYALRVYGKQVYTYSACHIFRKAHLSIYFK